MTADYIRITNYPQVPYQLVATWWQETVGPDYGCLPQHVELASKAARWGADQQLDQCCDWAVDGERSPDDLRAYCRPETQANGPLRKLAIEAFERIVRRNCDVVQEASDVALIQAVLEAIPNG